MFKQKMHKKPKLKNKKAKIQNRENNEEKNPKRSNKINLFVCI